MSTDRMPPPCHLTSWTKEDQPSDGFLPTDTVRCQCRMWPNRKCKEGNPAALQYRGGKDNKGEREGEDRGQGWGCMYSWSPQSTVRARMTRIQEKLGHVEKFSCTDPSSIICLPLCTASSSHFPSKLAKDWRFNRQTMECFWDFPN